MPAKIAPKNDTCAHAANVVSDDIVNNPGPLLLFAAHSSQNQASDQSTAGGPATMLARKASAPIAISRTQTRTNDHEVASTLERESANFDAHLRDARHKLSRSKDGPKV